MSKYNADDFKDWGAITMCDGGSWVLARPLNYKYDSLFYKLKLAWGVVTGKYDVVEWSGNQ